MPTITITRFHRTRTPGGVRAFASVQINEVLVIHGCRLVEKRDGGLFVTMPQKKSEKDGKWYDDVTVLDKALKALIEAKVITHYEQADGAAAPQPVAAVEDTF